jgi:hypothetical protein
MVGPFFVGDALLVGGEQVGELERWRLKELKVEG